MNVLTQIVDDFLFINRTKKFQNKCQPLDSPKSNHVAKRKCVTVQRTEKNSQQL